MIANKRKFVSCLKGNLQQESKAKTITIAKLESVSFILAFRLAETKWTPSVAFILVPLYPKFGKEGKKEWQFQKTDYGHLKFPI